MIETKTFKFVWVGENSEGHSIRGDVDITGTTTFQSATKYIDKKLAKLHKSLYKQVIDPKTKIISKELVFPILP